MKLVDYNPDHRPSSSGMEIEERGDEVFWMMKVKGYGAILLRGAYAKNGLLTFQGVSTFTDAEIGWRT